MSRSRAGAGRPLPSPPVIHAGCRLGFPDFIRNANGGVPASGASPWSDAASFILCYPFIVEAPTKLFKAFWVNGASPGSNIDVAVYDADYNFLTSTGAATAGSGANAPQVVTLSPQITIQPGLYYCGMSCDATTTGRFFRWSIATPGISFWKAAGCFKSNATDAPPISAAAITPAAYTNIALPLFGLITRSVFDV